MFRSKTVPLSHHVGDLQHRLPSSETRSVPAPGGSIDFNLHSDDPAVLETFRQVWPPATGSRRAATIFASPLVLMREHHTFQHLIDPDRHISIVQGDLGYSAVKVAIRTMLVRHFERDNTLFLHAATCRYAGRGIAILGASGAGKSTLLGELFKSDNDFLIVNDDWGPLIGETSVYMGEEALHMKLGSLLAIPRAPAEREHLTRTQDYSGRVLISRERAFEGRGVAPSLPISIAILIRRESMRTAGRNPLTGIDLEYVKRGVFSKWYGSRERWLDGARFNEKHAYDERVTSLYHRLMTRVMPYTIFNSDEPDAMLSQVDAILEEVTQYASSDV